MWIGHRKEIRELRWPIHVINPVDKTNLPYNRPFSKMAAENPNTLE